MRKSRRKLEMDNIVLRIRVQTLENKLCPTNQHDWAMVDYSLEGGTGCGDETLMYHYQCRRCDKILDTSKILERQ